MSDDPAPLYKKGKFELLVHEHKTMLAGLIFFALSFVFGHASNPYLGTALSAVAISLLSLTVSEVADVLAERLNEPYGSFVLTFSAVVVEILLLFMVLVESAGHPAALDTVKAGIISAVIVDMNVLLGLAVLIGGLAFKEQEHNEETSSAYTTVLLVASLALLVPTLLEDTSHTKGELMKSSIIISILLFIFYIVIFTFQTKTHRHFFKATARSRIFRYKRKLGEYDDEDEYDLFDTLSTGVNFVFIFMLILAIGFSAEVFATDGMHLVKTYNIPVGLAGLIIAIISVAPEIVTAVRAAKNDQIQRVVNIAMGASVVSILLTVPILMLLSYMVANPLILDFNTFQVGALIFTVILAWKTTDDGQTNYFDGTSHLMFFICYAVIAAFL